MNAVTQSLLLVVVVALNLTPVPRRDYRVGVPNAGVWCLRLCSDDAAYGGSGHERHPRVDSEPVRCHGEDDSIVLVLPPLAALVLERLPNA